MSDIEKTIAYFKNCVVVTADENDSNITRRITIKALEEKLERENPQPLTVDTLYFMDRHPVWWWNKSHAPVCTLCVKNKADANNPFFVCFDDPFADDYCTGLVKYQKLIKWGWRPYQYPPKEATHAEKNDS